MSDRDQLILTAFGVIAAIAILSFISFHVMFSVETFGLHNIMTNIAGHMFNYESIECELYHRNISDNFCKSNDVVVLNYQNQSFTNFLMLSSIIFRFVPVLFLIFILYIIIKVYKRFNVKTPRRP